MALELGALEVSGVSSVEQALASRALPAAPALIRRFRDAIASGDDPLGRAFCTLRSAVERRPLGAIYTPSAIVSAMLSWAATRNPNRVVDPGAGTGRFIVAAGRRFPQARLVAAEVDPLAALLARAHLAGAGLADRATVVRGDYRELVLPRVSGPTLFLGNPPYVRHHLLGARWKAWLVERAAALGISASQRSGLHVHFFLATALHARTGDYGAFVTAAEWLDVNYGALVRQLFLGKLGGRSLNLLEPTLKVFPDADTTAAIACFEVGTQARSVRLRRVGSLAALSDLDVGRPVRRERLQSAPRWTPLAGAARKAPSDFVELGELCRVHRGQVTGANAVWIVGDHSQGRALDALAQHLSSTTTLGQGRTYAGGLTKFEPKEMERLLVPGPAVLLQQGSP